MCESPCDGGVSFIGDINETNPGEHACATCEMTEPGHTCLTCQEGHFLTNERCKTDCPAE